MLDERVKTIGHLDFSIGCNLVFFEGFKKRLVILYARKADKSELVIILGLIIELIDEVVLDFDCAIAFSFFDWGNTKPVVIWCWHFLEHNRVSRRENKGALEIRFALEK